MAITIAPGNADPRQSFSDSARTALALCAPDKRPHLMAVLAKVDLQRVEEIREKYATDIHERFPQEPASEIKFLDLPYWLSHKLDLAMRLRLHTARSRSVLDLSTGGSHFLAICQSFGHRAVGIDFEQPLYADIAHCLNVRRLVERVEPQTKLLDRGERFDLVTAIWITFNSLPSKDGKRRYWSLDDWTFFVRDLIEGQMRLPGQIHLELNPEYSDDTPPVGRFNSELLAMFKRQGAQVDEKRGYITFYCPA